jgi:hypothetical protein
MVHGVPGSHRGQSRLPTLGARLNYDLVIVFVALVEAELGESYRFERLGTHLTRDDLAAERPELPWRPVAEDPYYVEPVVLAWRLAG